jgi:hypothetical protein
MDEHIIHEEQDEDAWVCLCGNTPSNTGFFPINDVDDEVEPIAKNWTTDLLCCGDCGRVIDQNTLKVVRLVDVDKANRIL